MNTKNASMMAVLAFGAGLLIGAGPAVKPGVISLTDAPERVHPSGKARVRHLSTAGAQAWVGLLELDAGGRVPTHRDDSDEIVHFVEGGGTLWIDGTPHTVGPGDTVTMPSGVEVRFEARPDSAVKVLQVFAPPASAKKYDAWTPR